MRPVGLPAGVLAIAAQAATPTGPYWIVAGSFADPDYTHVQVEAVRRASAAVADCGLKPFRDFSGKFVGFGEGFDVVVIGGYARRAAAEADLRRLRRCVPTAYVREGTYAGE
ncbi:SPOR domain-containing protein (plasmid) [Methylobacterium sp. NMS12]|uniref:SPOR domain-containing protein n=1 Tax=Methylobacterium sp. NMS12 TaxID=3079766 RepID=UPI003F885E16